MDLPSEVVDLKIAVLGKSLVGKSALTYRFINDKFQSMTPQSKTSTVYLPKLTELNVS